MTDLKITNTNTYISMALVLLIVGGVFWIGWQLATMNLKIDNLSDKVGDNNARYDTMWNDHEIRLRQCEARFQSK